MGNNEYGKLSLTKNSQTKSKVIKSHAIHLIRFCLKSGITENQSILQFLNQNEIVLKGRTFDRYKSLAEKELQNDLDADIWLSERFKMRWFPTTKTFLTDTTDS
jgi:hypothetical protein